MKANREYELRVRKSGRGPALLRDPSGKDHIEVVEIATGEVALFWDTTRPRPGGSRAACAPTSPRSTPTRSSRSGHGGRWHERPAPPHALR